MPRFTYSPEGAEPRSWPYEPNRMMNAETEAIERKTGMGFAEWQHKVEAGSTLAIHGLLWVLLKRKDPTLRWEQVEFCMADVALDYDDDEAELIRQSLAETLREGGQLTDGELELLEVLGGVPETPDPAEVDTPLNLDDTDENGDQPDVEDEGPKAESV